jgi:hypothetical protein
MKKTLLTLALVAVTAATSFGQGKITFGNDSTRLFTIGDALPGDPSGPVPSGPLPSGVSLVASLYAGTASSMALQTSITLTGADFLTAGRMANKAVLLTVAGGAPVTFQIVLSGSDATRPTTLTGAAVRDNLGSGYLGYFGTSGLFTATPGTSVTYPFIYQTTAPVNSTWGPGGIVANAIIPEPSSMALAGLGAASLLLFRRRK